MSIEPLECDYLVVGAGASAMSFVDVILEMTDATVVMVDPRERPGGHWNDAYPFVRLHQPSACYGVTSRPLGNDTIDTSGTNMGLYELASASEIVTYFNQVMDQTFLASGRVKYVPLSSYRFDGTFESNLTGTVTTVDYQTLVDARYVTTSVPATSPPPFNVDEGVTCIPPNDVPQQRQRSGGFVLVGAGKTAIDTCLYLLEHGVDPDAITWVRPRDPWLADRATNQPGLEFAPHVIHRAATIARGSASAETLEELFAGFEAAGVWMRIDPTVQPTMWRCATVTRADVEQLQRVTNVVRMGRVKQLTTTEMVLDGGTVPIRDAIYVNCTAKGLGDAPRANIFEGNTIRLQNVKGCQPTFSAAVVAYVEAHYDNDDDKNDLCQPVPYPTTDADWVWFAKTTSRNAARWRQEPQLAAWLATMRLNMGRPPAGIEDTDLLETITEIATLGPTVQTNLQRLLDHHNISVP